MNKITSFNLDYCENGDMTLDGKLEVSFRGVARKELWELLQSAALGDLINPNIDLPAGWELGGIRPNVLFLDGWALEKLRADSGKTRKEVAALAGIDIKTYRTACSSKEVSRLTAKKLADFHGVEVETLLHEAYTQLPKEKPE